MAFLLDTHALLWWLAEPERLSPAVHPTLSDPGQPMYVSAASAWEIDAKHRLGRLPTADVLLTLDPALDPFPCQTLW